MPPDIEKIEAERRTTAHADLARWLGGDHTSNNPWRWPCHGPDRAGSPRIATDWPGASRTRPHT
ncbi:hypothetical protein [Streptomyces hygroscopicus]|uniref:hypothetical protein n=1 Tax=Streptomyces hygroscopicus TaxID=1912 RepID=UPI001F433AAA|nr:hypothetical protein [Streptomyces hygroscopicus]